MLLCVSADKAFLMWKMVFCCVKYSMFIYVSLSIFSTDHKRLCLSAIYFKGTFNGAAVFNQNLASWNVAQVKTMLVRTIAVGVFGFMHARGEWGYESYEIMLL